jgi:PAS domain S-box-containing protein
MLDIFFQWLGPITIAYFFIVYSYAYFQTNKTIITRRSPVNSQAFSLFAIWSTLGALNSFYVWAIVAGLGYTTLACWGICTVCINEYMKKKIRNDISLITAWQDALDLASDPISVYDERGKPVIWNQSLAEITGYSHKEVVEYWTKNGEVSSLLYRGKELDRVREKLSHIHESGGYANEPFTLTSKSGEIITLTWCTKPYKRGSIRKGQRTGIPLETNT